MMALIVYDGNDRNQVDESDHGWTDKWALDIGHCNVDLGLKDRDFRAIDKVDADSFSL